MMESREDNIMTLTRDMLALYHWFNPRSLCVIAVRFRAWSCGPKHSMFVRTWAFGPILIAFTNLDRP